MSGTAEDKHSYANIHQCHVTSLNLDLDVDFITKRLSGFVELAVDFDADNVTELVLDTRDIDVQQVTLGSQVLAHELAAASEVFGSKLTVKLGKAFNNKEQAVVKVRYQTSPQCTALGWLEKEQTADKQHPYLYSQCEAIHARSLLPCQDSPARKVKYTATLRVPSPLVAVMSAESTGHSTEGNKNSFTFRQNVPIPTYLIALGVGAIEYRAIGPRTGVWSEKSVVDKAAKEFEDTEKMVHIAEELFTPYVWGKYDILLLPPSFPFGGMENPCLTFATPTLLAGDKSNVNVIAHELAHSWSGNLVTNKNWENFWLNEGFTVFFERKIVGKIYGQDMFDLAAMIGWRDLEKNIETFGHDSPLTWLKPKLDNIDPDDAFSSVPYEKGFAFLYYLEQQVGGATVFEPFLKAYLTKFAYKSLTTEEFVAFFLDYFRNQAKVDESKLSAINWDNWFNTPGLPPRPNTPQPKLAVAAKELAAKWVNHQGEGCTENDLKSWFALQIVTFLDELLLDPSKLNKETVLKLDKLYKLSASGNAEILFRWYQLSVSVQHEDEYPKVVTFATSQGRMKYVRPLFRSLFKAGDKGKELAHKTFAAHKDFYHPICRRLVEKDIEFKA